MILDLDCDNRKFPKIKNNWDSHTVAEKIGVIILIIVFIIVFLMRYLL